jgi:hypothetical protein
MASADAFVAAAARGDVDTVAALLAAGNNMYAPTHPDYFAAIKALRKAAKAFW